MPNLVEVRYKNFKDLDYVSGLFLYFDINDLPHSKEILAENQELFDEVTLRIMNEKAILTMAEQLVNDNEVQALYEMFDIDPFENVVVEESNNLPTDVVEIEVIYINNVDMKLALWYKEKRNETEA